ncbi:hypothetical protein DE146DRAFT_602963 [Phaeosphaeria sp. MPI-PUGE-AT-0046c]|nr:hypothetical protein DE146DRAFT_602963 [Phaeosphaeria sp. MPI-PUGE-AT-0046c]
MTSFKGPWSQDLDAIKEAVKSMPEQYKSSFSSASKKTLEKVCDPDVLHVWETDSDIDNLLQLISVIAKLCNLGMRKDKGANADDGSMVILAEEKAGRNNFARICQLVGHLTCADGKKHLEGTVAAFGTIIVVKGWNNSVRSEKCGRDVDDTVKRLNISIERAFRKGSSSDASKEIVWHHGPVIHFLLYWINNTTSSLRSSLSAITVTDSLDLTSSIKPSRSGRANTLPDLTCLESYALKLSIPVVFLDCASQLLLHSSLATYMYYYAYYINTFLPPSLLRPHLHAAQDALVTFCFRIAGASRSEYGDQVVAQVKRHLDPSSARAWASSCIDKRSYTKAECRAAGRDGEIHRAVGLGDGPFLLFNHNYSYLSAFARLAVGPAAKGAIDSYVAAPVSISFSNSRMRPAYPAAFHVLIPAPGQDEEKVTNYVQGLMMAVLERVRQEKGNPVLGREVRDMWSNGSKACAAALHESRGKMPKDVERKVGFVKEKLEKGTWACVVGGNSIQTQSAHGGSGNGKSEAANANAEAARMYGTGGNQFGNQFSDPTQQQQQQQQQQQMGMGMMQQDMMAPQSSPQMAYPQHMDFAGQQGILPPPPPQQHYDQGYGAPIMQFSPGRVQQGVVGHGGGHPQGMGGPRR